MEAPKAGSLQAPAKATEITLDTFKQWTKDCGVRRVQKEYDEISAAAQSNKRTVQAEMKARGFKDFHALSKACPRFPARCWPIELGELGSGYVLYFQFLTFLAIIFFTQLLLQIPAIATYAQFDDLVDWQWHDWNLAYSDRGSCSCIGNSSGYAATCGAWDLDLCDNATTCSLPSAGLWVCQSWCYANEFCPTLTRTDLPSMRSVHVKDNAGTRLVRTYSACQQNKSLISECGSDFRSANVPYSGPLVDGGKPSDTVGQGWCTPGNLGPDQGTSSIPATMYTVCVIVLCVTILMAYQHQVLTDNKVDANTTSPNDFAIMVKGLPSTATDEQAIMDFFTAHSVRGKSDTEIVKVVIGWDFEEYREKIRALKELSKQLKELEPDDPKVASINAELKQTAAELSSAAPDKASRLRSSGVVVVSFRYQSDLRACLKRWGSFWARWFSSDAVDGYGGFLKGAPLPRFPIGGREVSNTQGFKLEVQRAADPGDIHWEELGVPRADRYKMLAKTNGVMSLLILVSFGIVYGLRKLSDYVRDEGSQDLKALAILPALSVAIINGALMYAARKLGEKEYHDTLTTQEFSQALKMSLGMIVNTGGVLLFQQATPSKWYQGDSLVNNVFTMLLINALAPPFIAYLSIGYAIKSFTRRKLSPENLLHFNSVVARGAPTTAEGAKELKEVTRQIDYFKRAFAPGQMNCSRRYANALKTFICCLWFQPLLPFLSILGFVAIVLQYLIDKHLLLNWYERPNKPANASIANFSVRFIKYVAPIGLAIAVFGFLTPSFANKGMLLSNFIISILVATGFSILCPLSIWIRCYLGMPCTGGINRISGEEDYYRAQYMWSKEMKYHKDQFIYKNLPESKNPEFLDPNKSAATKVEDVKASYGVATAQVTASAVADVAPATVLKGGHAVDEGALVDEVSVSMAPGSGPAATAYGASSSVGGDLPGGAPMTASSASSGFAGPAVPAGGYVAGSAESPTRPLISEVHVPGVDAIAAPYVPGGAIPRSSRVTWEFEVNDHYSAFSKDCQSFMEARYQKFVGGGTARVTVRTSGMDVSIDFEKMSSKKDGSHKIRKIQRKESE
ncbi:unnamed protein product [Polarella glacialis]|uniref:WWE domain-containing protein n=1 Tax=Polarella glacialis TaxID=89957 RepID=A0A813JWI3_POLGL|nr:unnamed protein product [Polarella glacialis]CAE8685189.1 unnamed protein product [Polarella glacialis]